MTDAEPGPEPPAGRVPGADADVVVRLVGVYDADHTVRGELLYWVGARLGTAHCALCDITHGLVRAKRPWHEYRAKLPVPFDTYHRDDQPEAVRALGTVPVVVAETAGGVRVLLDAADLESCGGSVDALALAVAVAIADAGLRWPGAPA
ncbi:MAG: hypothetical protein FJW95_02940 [Actinobacteria bacterium]|nr:hypothetical protein [Actinomycetota bacterium]